MNPPVNAARLTGQLPVTIKVTATAGGTLTNGKSWSDTWTFSPKCGSGACSTVLSGDITPPGTSTHSFKVTLTRHGATYTGSTRRTHHPLRHDAERRRRPQHPDSQVKALSGHLVNGRWVVDRWKGTVRMVSPYTSAGLYYCPAQTVVMTLTGR